MLVEDPRKHSTLFLRPSDVHNVKKNVELTSKSTSCIGRRNRKKVGAFQGVLEGACVVMS